MRKPIQPPQVLALTQLCELVQRLMPEPAHRNKRTVPASATTLRQLETTGTLIYTTTEEACARLLSVCNGLVGILQLLDVWGERSTECRCLYSLLAPLKRELDGAVQDVQAML
ncbi:hypothetical protein ACH51_07170 [Ralstonia solanacearum]|nr:hypothetical protein ACH51_07170 [Ralstonia solanacearum]